jgi:hypothetical protein
MLYGVTAAGLRSMQPARPDCLIEAFSVNMQVKGECKARYSGRGRRNDERCPVCFA